MNSFLLIELNTGNRKREQCILETLNLTFKPSISSYKGFINESWCVDTKTIGDLEVLLYLAEIYQQESVLLVDKETKDGSLVYIYPRRSESLGRWTEITKSEAKVRLNWTLVDKLYYVCK